MAKLTPKEKIAIQRDNVSIKKQLTTGGLKVKEKTALQRKWKENLKTLGATSKPKPKGGDDIVVRYIAGGFSAIEIADFIRTIDDVEAAGASLEQIKIGAKLWAEANQVRLAA